MTGLFALWQPRYAAAGIATFPVTVVGKIKKPAVRNYMQLGHKASGQMLLKFGEVDALGFVLGARSRISVLDVDTPDERIFADALNRHGHTPVIVRSGSGHHQAWYRHAGERRDTVTWRKHHGLPIDILGGGFVVAPPSQGSRGLYEFIEGGLDDLDRLPVLKGLEVPLPPVRAPVFKNENAEIGEGHRNVSLWRACMRHAARGGDRARLLTFAQQFNRNCQPPLSDEEVASVVDSAWSYTERGDNWFVGGNGMITIGLDAVADLGSRNPEALALLMLLRSWHYDRDEFYLANATHKKVGWTLVRFKAARDRLTEIGKIKCVHPGGRGPKDPPVYAWN